MITQGLGATGKAFGVDKGAMEIFKKVGEGGHPIFQLPNQVMVPNNH